MVDDLEEEFLEVIHGSISPQVIAEGKGWLLAELVPGVYEAVLQRNDSSMLLAMSPILRAKQADIIDQRTLEDGRILLLFIGQ